MLELNHLKGWQLPGKEIESIRKKKQTKSFRWEKGMSSSWVINSGRGFG
jgi:hypothetical protein